MIIEYDGKSRLPISTARNESTAVNPQINTCVTDDENNNLSPTQKRLLHWHFRLAHLCCASIQRLFRSEPFTSHKFVAASKCELPQCETCHYAKARRLSTKGKISRVDKVSDGNLKVSCLRHGESISCDHIESRLKGRTYTSYEKTTSDQYVGGCIFVDHMSGYIHVEHQLGFSSSETIRATLNFEQLALDNGVLIQSHLADNGIFKSIDFVSHIRQNYQRIKYCGSNAHHKNGIAERNILTISNMARSILLYSSCK